MYMYVYTSICTYVIYLLHVLGRHMHVYASICKYMHVYHIFAYTNCLQVCICMYMYVYNGICMYIQYMYVLCSYMHVFTGMTPSDTGTDATSPKNTLRGRQSAGHTQGTPRHLSIHFIQPLAKVVQTRFGALHPAARVLGP